jgi:glycogen operon protein
MSPESRHLAYYLDGASENDDDLYVMINADERDLSFTIHEGDPTQWRRVIDTSRKSPADFCEPGKKTAIRSAKYVVKGRSVVVLVRPR